MNAPLATFQLSNGSHLALYANRVVHEGMGELEIVPIAQLASVHVAYERDERLLNWAIGLLLAALLLALLSGPLQSWASAAIARVSENARKDSVEAVLLAVFAAVRGLGRILPHVATLATVLAAVLGVLFWIGRTALTLSFAAVERRFVMRGRNPQLMEFAEVLGEQVSQRAK